MITQIGRNGSWASGRSCRTLASVTLAAMLGIVGCGTKGESELPKADSSAETVAVVSDSAAGHDHGADGARQQGTKLEFVSTPAAIQPGEPATWRLTVVDRSGKPVTDFARVHEKLMHLIVVSSDLSWFNHIHPEYKGEGVFEVSALLPKAGSYKLYADYTPQGGTQEVPQQEIATEGAAVSSTPAALVADTVGRDGWIRGRFASGPEGEPEKKSGAPYEVALMPMPTKLVAGKDMMLHFQISDASGKPVTDLEPYLGAMGHLVILSSDTKSFLHAHPMDGGMESMAGMDHGSMDHSKMDHGSATPGGAHSDSGSAPHAHAAPTKGGPDVIFHTSFPQPGRYKLWGQFRHKGRIITAAFVIDVAAAA
jgi:predicted small lipoprotein YifL